MGKFIEHVSRTRIPMPLNQPHVFFCSTTERSRSTRSLEEVSGDILHQCL